MIDIKFRDTFQITGRGLVYSCDLEDNPNLDHFKLDYLKEVGEVVKINNKKYIIKGIERFALPTSLMHHSSKVGLLVEEINE